MRIAALSVLALLALSQQGASQSLELGITGGYGAFRDNSLLSGPAQDGATEEFRIADGVRIGGRMAFNPSRYLGHEISYSYQHSGLEYLLGPDAEDLGTVRAHNTYYNVVAHAFPEGSYFRPFVTGGGGFTSFFLPGLPSFSGYGDTKFGYNYGAGIKVNFFAYGIRVDVRDHITGKPFGRYLGNVQGSLHNMEFSVTFSFLVG